MDKLTPDNGGASKDIVAENIEKLKQLFPDVFTEGSDGRDAVDFDALKAVLGEYIEPSDERYSFTWHGKAAARRIAQTPSTGTLRPCREKSVDWDTTKNLFIEGDNLEVLKLLQKSYHGKVKMIYIDPPYNTGNEFIYPDKYQDNLQTYLEYTGQVDSEGRKFSTNSETDGRYHTNWLNMMYPRLRLARNLLREDGVIFISIDDHENSNLGKVLDEVFGEENRVTTFVWEKRKTRENRKVFSFNHDFIICYARDITQFEETRNPLPPTDEVLSRYSNPDDDPRGDWQSISLNAQAGHGTPAQFYDITTPGGRVVSPPSGRCWSVTRPRFEELVADGRVWFGQDGNNVPRLKSFRSETELGLTPHTLWKADEVGTTDSAKKNLISLFDDVTVFDTPKPVPLLERMVHIATQDGDLVLDFFAGSCPAAEAVISLATREHNERTFLMVQLPEPCPEESEAWQAGYETIADIGKERIRRAAKKIKEEHPDYDGDLGFRVLKLSSSNIKPWDADFDTLEQSLFDSLNNIKEDRSEEDVLYEILLKYGLDLTVPIEERTIAGAKVYSIGVGALVVCLSPDVTLDVVEGIAALKDELNPEVMRVVFRDNGFKDDVVKTNAVQILRQHDIIDVKSL